MAQILPWVALVLSGLVLGHAAARSAGVKAPLLAGVRSFFFAALALLGLGAAATLPTTGMWSSGQALWPGFLLGGFGVILSALVGRSSRFAGGGGRFIAAAARIAAATLPAAGVVLLYPTFRHGFLDVLGGLALGALTVGILMSGSGVAGEDAEGAAEAAQFGALTLLALTTATFLAVYHPPSASGVREWLPLPALLAGTAAATLTVRGVLGGQSPAVTLGVIGLPLGVMAWLIGFRLGGTPAFFYAVLIGLAIYALLAWLERVDDGEAPRPFRADLGLLASLILLGGAALAFRERQGYGVALAALCGTFVWGASSGRESRSAMLPGGVALMLLIALYRVFTETNDYTRGFQPDFLYFYVALIAGALLPALLAGSIFRGAEGVRPTGALARLGLAGAAAVIAPLAVWLLVGERPQAAMLVGLAVGAGFLLSRSVTGPRTAGEVTLSGLLALAMGWATVQFTFLLQPLALGTRGQRVTVLIVVGVVALFGVLLGGFLERSGSEPPRRQERQVG